MVSKCVVSVQCKSRIKKAGNLVNLTIPPNKRFQQEEVQQQLLLEEQNNQQQPGMWKQEEHWRC